MNNYAESFAKICDYIISLISKLKKKKQILKSSGNREIFGKSSWQTFFENYEQFSRNHRFDWFYNNCDQIMVKYI